MFIILYISATGVSFFKHWEFKIYDMWIKNVWDIVCVVKDDETRGKRRKGFFGKNDKNDNYLEVAEDDYVVLFV